MRLFMLLVLLIGGLSAEEVAAEVAAVQAELMRAVPERWRSPVPIPASDPKAIDAVARELAAAGTAAVSPDMDDPLWQVYLRAGSWTKPWPADDTALSAWLDDPRRREAVAALDRVLAKGERTGTPEQAAGSAGNLQKLLTRRIRRALAAGDGAEAEADLSRLIRLGQLVRSEHGALAAMIDTGMTMAAMQALVAVAAGRADPAVIARLRGLLPDQRMDPDDLQRRLVCTLIRDVAKSPEDGPRLLQDLQAMHLRGALVREAVRDQTGAIGPATDRSALLALADVPVALDRRATIDLYVRLSAGIDPERPLSEALRAGPIHDLIAEVGNAGDLLNPAADFVNDVLQEVKPGAPPLTGAAGADAGFRRLLAGPNPMGRILVALSFSAQPIFDDNRRSGLAMVRMAHAALTLIEAHARSGAWPAQLPADAPTDPFTGAALHWDPDRRRLWSVGKDGRDDGGDRKDLVMPLGGP